ncbi:MAG: glucuronate isomerase [Parafilimonas sp.]|nr:glucuronate isomerase [Parafilimonas sp.]
MQTFITENFLLQNNTAKKLYFDHVQHLPVIDYHNHLSPADIANNKIFQSITEAWLNGDHYKWRAMRANGIDENLITGNADDYSKFKAWANTVPYTMRNPLYHWTHLELKHPFNIHELLNSESAEKIYQECNELLQTKFSVLEILNYHKVELLCTTDSPADDLKFHRQFAQDDHSLKMLPTFRPDALLNFNERDEWIKQFKLLEQSTNTSINTFNDFIVTLQNRVEYFHSNGCRLSDHGFEYMPAYSSQKINYESIFLSLLQNKDVLQNDIAHLKAYVLIELCKMYHSKNWVQQFHLGAMRNNNSRLFKLIGKDAGTDSIGDYRQANALSSFLNELEKGQKLAKTILYNLNPADNELFATLAGNFNDGSVEGKIQWGAAWWFLDQKDGIEKQLNTLSNMGLLSRFVGMVTDSRSFLSFSRHDYFRRILCNVIGNDIEKGELPNDLNWLGEMLINISYYNAKHFFNWQ